MDFIQLPKPYNETEICHETEIILNNNDFGRRMVIAFNELPLFLTTNLEAINDRILKNEGTLEIISQDFSKLKELPINLFGGVWLYKTEENISEPFSFIYDQNAILYGKEKFILFEDKADKSKKFLDKFEKMVGSLESVSYEKLQTF